MKELDLSGMPRLIEKASGLGDWHCTGMPLPNGSPWPASCLCETRCESAVNDVLEQAPALIKALTEAREESHELTKALTGLTCGGSEFFIRKGERYVADIPACVEWVRRRDTNAHDRSIEAIRKQRAAEAERDALKAETTLLSGQYDQMHALAVEAATKPRAAEARNADLSGHVRRLIDDIEEYERINNLVPNPGKPDCWQSVTAAKASLAHGGAND